MHARATLLFSVAAMLVGLAAGCPNPDVEGDPQEQALLSVKEYITGQLGQLHDASVALQAAAPDADADGWNAADDPAALSEMKAHWKDARASYERVEGAIAVLFPDLDVSSDARYDDFLGDLGGDDDLFDGEGVTGVHAIERILFSDQIPEVVTTFEEGIPGYVAARFPETQAEADAFKGSLCQRLVDDTQAMVDQFEPLALDTQTAYRGVIGSMGEQIEKLELAGEGQDESRYAQATLFDMRNNLEGGVNIFNAFAPMFDATDGGEEIETSIRTQLTDVQGHYDAISGDSLPAVPDGWNSDAPSADQLATPYGQLFTYLSGQTDTASDDSLVSLMSQGGDVLGIPQLP